MAKNPFDDIVKMYNEQVEENDKAGYAKKFKNCAELFFQKVNEEFALKESPVHFEDIQFLDGYFIFGYGTNSVVHFHIKECPGWLFGIWWTIPDGSNPEQRYISGELFTQYEETLDKFKPSRSCLCTTITAIPDEDDQICSCYTAAKMIAFIRNEPYLAFCRDYCRWNYNEEYHTREEARAKYDEYRVWQDNKVKYTKECDERVIAFVKERILPLFTDAEIHDNGENCSPRYDVIAPLKKNKDLVDECGCYEWFEDDDKEGKKTMEEFNALIKECEALSDKYEFFWSVPFNPDVYFYKK